MKGSEARVNQNVQGEPYFIRYDWVWKKSSWAFPWSDSVGTANTYDFYVPEGSVFDKFSAKE